MIGEADLHRELEEFHAIFSEPEQVEQLLTSWGIDEAALAKWSKEVGYVNNLLGKVLNDQEQANAVSFLSGFITGWRLCLQKED